MMFVRYDHSRTRRCWVSIKRYSASFTVHVGCHDDRVSPLGVLANTRARLSAADRDLLTGDQVQALLEATSRRDRAVSFTLPLPEVEP
ncbi:MAG: hypothetical protein GY719_26070 [bacterium]|nr:hypothetical protein [bacterium]